jgi:hypothetical protein
VQVQVQVQVQVAQKEEAKEWKVVDAYQLV